MTQTYASEFRKGKILWDTKEMFITKVENVNEKMDILYITTKKKTRKEILNEYE